MASIHDSVQLRAARDGANDGLVDLVVEDHPVDLVVERAEGLIEPVQLVAAAIVDLLRTVAREVEDEGVAGPDVGDQPPHRGPHVLLRRDPIKIRLGLCRQKKGMETELVRFLIWMLIRLGFGIFGFWRAK